jgi:hypothetical protein
MIPTSSAIFRREIGMKRWTEACTEILKRTAPAGYTDQEIADNLVDDRDGRL